MFSLLHEVHFWTQKDGVFIKDLDYGAFMYDKKTTHNVLQEGKKSYAESRGLHWSLSNKRPKKLREGLKEFEDLLYNARILNTNWRNPSSIQVIFSNGLQVYLTVNPGTGDIVEVNFDKFMIGKLSSQYISDTSISSSHAVFSYTDNQVTLVYFTKPALKFGSVKKWNSLDVKCQNHLLSGPVGRRLDKQLSLNTTADMLLIWWKCGNDEVYPWSPVVKEEDRSNVHIYSINSAKLDLLNFYNTEYDPLSIQFSHNQPNVIHTLQQKVSRKNEVTVDWSTSEINYGQLEITNTVSLLVPTLTCVTSLSPNEDKLIIACIDGTLLSTDCYGNITNTSKGSFTPSLASWHPDGCLIIMANERGQIQWFDSYLNCIKCQLMSEDEIPCTVIDVGCYFKYQPTLVGISWNRNSQTSDASCDFDDLLLLQFERGPFAVLKLVTGSGEKKLSADVVISRYLADNKNEEAVNFLYTLSWEHEGETALSSLQKLVSHIIRQPLTPQREIILEKALGSYHNPVKTIPESVESELTDSIHDLSRRFFHHLLRYQVFEKAFRLAIDLNEYDLFMDIHNYCKKLKNTNMAVAALERAEEIIYSESDSSSEESSCSCCTESTDHEQRIITPPLPIIHPPQPAPRSRIKYLRIPQASNITTIQEISPNAIGIPTIDDLNYRLVSHSITKTETKPNYIAGSSKIEPKTNFLSNNKDTQVENGKIKVVNFGLV